MTSRRLSYRILALALVSFLAVACGSDGDSGAPEATERPAGAISDDDAAGQEPRQSADGTEDGAASDDPDRGAEPTGATIEALAPLEGLDRLDGGSLDLATVREVPVVVWFWAPWCPNCRAMAPDLAAVADEYGDRVEFIGVAGRGERDEMDEFVASTGAVTLPHVVDDDGSAWAAFGVVSQPALALVSTDGSVELVSGVQRRDALHQRLADLLGS